MKTRLYRPVLLEGVRTCVLDGSHGGSLADPVRARP